jgi:Holliday junction resolvase RusA-like endonuclease
MSTISFFVSGEPKAQPRPKAFARNFGGKWMARVYTPGSAEYWKSQIAIAAKPFLPTVPFAGPIKLSQVYYFARPKSHYRTGKNASLLRPDAPVDHESKPDCENLQKATQDALTQLGFWRDDSQVSKWDGHKVYCDEANPQPGCWITIAPLNPPERQIPPQAKIEALELFGKGAAA